MAINVPLNAQLQNATQLQQQVQNAVNAVRINLGGANGARSLSALSQPLGRLTGQADEFTKSLDAANARVLAFGASVGVVNAVSNAFKALVTSTIEVEKALTEISVVGDQFRGGLKDIGTGLFDIAKQTGQSFGEVSKAALEFARQGLSLEDTLQRTKDALILTRTTGLDAAKSVDGLTAAVNAFSKAGLSTTQVLNKLAAVDQAFAVSSADLIEAFQRTGAVAQQAGVSFDELAGIVTALQTETSRGGAVIGNALKTIFSRLQDTSVLVQLQDLGVSVQDLQGNVLPARQILQNLAGDLQGLSKITQAGIFKDVAGTFQLNQLVSLLGDLNKEQSISAAATAKSAQATNEAYNANERLNQSLDAILNKVATTGKQIGALLGEIGLSDNLKGILDGINNFLEGATNVLQGDDLGSKFAKGIVKGIGSVLSGPGLMVFLAIIGKLSFDLAKFGAQSLKTFFGIGKAANDQKQIQESIVQVLLRNQNVLNQILSTQGGQNAQAQAFLGILNQQAAAMQTIQGLAGNIAGTVYGAGYRQTGQGLARRSAGGYLPAQEAADVRRGVGGASPSSKVVAIPNFAFGGGKRGTMIANTSEYIVPNYAGGGSAIFNPDMVKTMGLPAGAKKISAAGGFIPNFAENVSSKYALITNRASDTKLGETFSYKPKGSESAVSYQANIYGVNLSKLAGKGGSNLYNRKFSAKALEQRYTSFAVKDAKNFADKVIGQPISPVSVQNLTNAGVIPAVSGTIFETAIQSILTSDELAKKLREGPNALFDFVNTPKINEFFGVPGSVPYLEAKSTASNEARKSFAKKIYQEELKGNPALVSESVSIEDISAYQSLESKKTPAAKALYSKIANQMGLNPLTDRNKINAQMGRIIGKSSFGYIPNFAASALQDAIAREKSAGLSNSQIYIDQNPSLKSPQNPMGLMVANTRDEPFGGIQGISRARKEGMNPKLYGAANGFVPNYAVPSGLSGFAASLNQPANTGNIEKVNKGFGDMAGKIFLIQSALSFMNGAVGEATTSFGKLTQQTITTIGNISSLAFLGKEIAQLNPAGALGKFIKNAGLAGVAIGIAVEGFDLLNFAIKEFSGENEKAALASAKLADASDKLSIKFESLSKTRQTELETQASKILGSAGFRDTLSLFTGAIKGGGDIGGNADIQKSVAQLLALGASRNDILKVIESSKKYADATDDVGNTFRVNISKLSDIQNGFNEAVSSGLGKTLNDQFRSFETALAGIDLSGGMTGKSKTLREAAAKAYGKEDFSQLTPEQQKLVKDRINQQIELNKQKQEEQKAQNAINFGERLNLELAKKQVDSVFEIAKLKTQATTEEEASIQYRMQTLDLSNREKIIDESKLKLLELEKKARADIADSIAAAVDKAQGGQISVDVGKLNDLKTFLSGIDFTKEIDEDKFNKLAETLLRAYDIAPEQAKNLVKSIKEEQKSRESANKITGELINKDKERALIIDDTNQAFNNQLSTLQRIAQTAQSVANLNISFGNLDIGQTESAITRLQALTNNPNLTIGQKESIEKQVIALQKVNNETKKRNELEKYNADYAEIGTKILEKQIELNRALNLDQSVEENQNKIAKLRSELEGFGRDQEALTNNFNGSKIAIDANTQALSIQEQQIGQVISAYVSLNNQLVTFRRSAGERIAGAQLEQLGATDINTLAKAGIKIGVETEAASIQDNAENYKFIQEQTKLRETQFDIATAESEVRRRELQYELKYTQEIIDLKKSGATEQELIDARNRQILEQRSGKRGFERGLDTIQDRINNYRATLGEEIPNLFSQNLAQGLNDAISGAKDLKTALTDAATAFFQEITRKNISNLADLVTKGIGGAATKKGTSNSQGILSSIAGFFGFASGGLIKGGSGTRDDVPAMLMGGEYVVKKSAVNKYGKGFLDAINNGNMRGYAAGGMVDPQTFPTQTGRGGFFTPGDYGQGAITGKNELLTFATQSFTGGQYDYMGGFGMGGATVSLEPESARLSAFGRENSPMFERVQQSKDEAFRVYLEGLQKEKEYADLLDQIAKDKKARKKQLQTAIISAVVSSALSYAGNKYFPQGSKGSGKRASVGQRGYDPNAALSFRAVRNSPYNAELNLVGGTYRAAGGLISGGSNIRDDVPAMLTGGEFVLNNRATQRIGLQNLNRLNSGAPVSSEGSSPEITQTLIAKLDELIQTTANSSKENVVVNVSTNEAGGQTTENPTGTERDLQKKIRQAVLDVIAQEKRLGGSLEKSR
jgi:TP901 family phage tail tape measure protein